VTDLEVKEQALPVRQPRGGGVWGGGGETAGGDTGRTKLEAVGMDKSFLDS
jgi:hypothetical protein